MATLPISALRSNSSFYDINPFYNADSSASLTVTGAQAIKSAISFLITSLIGCRSRTFNTKWGSDLLRFINEPMDEMTALIIRSSILNAIDKWEPRVAVNASDVIVKPYPNINGYKVRIIFKVVGTDATESMTMLLQPNGY
jgi:phage baseplate assembly protein W